MFAAVFDVIPGLVLNTFSSLGVSEDDFYLTMILATKTFE